MKKLIIIFILITMFLVNIKSTECQNEYQIFYNYMEVEFPDVSPTVESGRTLVPFRTLAQALGVEVEYISNKEEIIGSKDSFEIKMKISDRKYYINDKEFVMLVAPKI
ncbi:MAG: copper amine oxidase N-terminal domain-containing protein, partial [Halanaerobiales bacterium]